MTGRERILAMVNHELPDRVPVTLSVRDELRRDLLAYYQTDDWGEVNRAFGIEGFAGAGVATSWPEWEARGDKEARPGDWPGSTREVVWLDDCTFEDQWGAIQRVGAGGKYLEYIRAPLEDATLDDLAEYPYPGPDRLIDDPDLPAKVQRLKDEGYYVQAGMEQPYKTAWRIRGMHQNLMDYANNREFKNALYDRIFETAEEVMRRVAAAGVDQFGIGGDIATQDRLIMGPKNWLEVDHPRLARLIEIGRSIKPDLHIFIHSDGNIMQIMDDLIEIGYDVINPIQPECMDPVEVKRHWGDRICLHGCGSIQQVLPFGTVQDVVDHVNHIISNCAVGGGLILAPSNVVQHDTPVENVVAFFETAMNFDLSTLP